MKAPRRISIVSGGRSDDNSRDVMQGDIEASSVNGNFWKVEIRIEEHPLERIETVAAFAATIFENALFFWSILTGFEGHTRRRISSSSNYSAYAWRVKEDFPLEDIAIAKRKDSTAWFSHYLRGVDCELTTIELSELLSDIEEIIKHGELSRIDSMLAHQDLSDLHVATIVAVLRFTFPVRVKLLYWSSFLAEASRELRKREHDPETLLRGLS